MAKFVGKNTRIKVGGTDLTASIASVTLNQTVNEVESTGFSSDSVQRIAGLQDASVTIDFHQDYASGSVAETVGSVLGGTAEIKILAGTALAQGICQRQASHDVASANLDGGVGAEGDFHA
jgi:hypothetical protein